MKVRTDVPATPTFVSLEVLRDNLASLGLSEGSTLEEAQGGQTSQVWRLSRSVGPDLIVKASHPDCSTPLFPNDPAQEWRAMVFLSARGIAPQPDSFTTLPTGGSLLLSQAVVETEAARAKTLAKLLAQIHASPPWRGLVKINLEPQSVLDQGAAMMSGDSMPKWLEHLKPRITEPGRIDLRLIHRDLVPANVVVTQRGKAVALDWQCPALGDPCEDIAHATSPAMQSLSQRHPRIDIEEVAEAYPDPGIRARFFQVEPLYRWRMACYCLWKLRHGEEQYSAALDMECAGLEKARERSERNG